MALTQNQYNDHIRQLIVRLVQLAPPDVVIHTAMDYARLGADQREAALRLLRELYQAQVGVDPTTSPAQRHEFKHWIDRVAAGEGVEA